MPLDAQAILNSDKSTALSRNTTTPLAQRKGAKFFSSHLNGNGKSRKGILNDLTHPATQPAYIPADEEMRPSYFKRVTRNGTVAKRTIPISPLLPRLYDIPGLHFIQPDTSSMFALDETTFINVVPTLVFIDEKSAKAADKKAFVRWNIEFYTHLSQDPNQYLTNVINTDAFFHATAPTLYVIQTNNVKLSIENFVKTHKLDFPFDKFEEYLIEHANPAKAITKQALLWDNAKYGRLLTPLISQIGSIGSQSFTLLNSQLQYMETYSIPLDAYREVYGALHTRYRTNSEEINTLTQGNMSLLMMNTIDQLAQVKPYLHNLHKDGPKVEPDPFFSAQQNAAIMSDEPLILIQAIAGAGKSSSILGRINYLTKKGINPKDIAAWSFTNAAADNLKAKNKDINSTTIARALIDIYNFNYPNHTLSSTEILLNCLQIKCGNDPFAREFAGLLNKLISPRVETSAFTRLNSFVAKNFDEVIRVLNTVGQTTLKLQQIICYQRIDLMDEPTGMTPKYLIIDEVQDNSVFEFIYALKYVIKHKIHLNIIGDVNQTLYEFRSANPRALSTLETSGIFTCYKLTTNYRSNPEVLEFANIVLADIDANKHARLQMTSHINDDITLESFTDRVKIAPRVFPLVRNLNDGIHRYFQEETKDFIEAALEQDEKVAILSPTRNLATLMQGAAEDMYPNHSIVSIMPELSQDLTTFSRFVRDYWNDIKQVPDVAQAAFAVSNQIQLNLASIEKRGDQEWCKQLVANNIANWYTGISNAIPSWVGMMNMGLLTRDQFFDKLAQSLIDWEIKNNSIRKSLTNEQNAEQKRVNAAANADIIVSTIHSVKGLEFDNVIILYRDDLEMDEADKRMYYVALTRAMKRELILATSNKDDMLIKDDYTMIVKNLSNKIKGT